MPEPDNGLGQPEQVEGIAGTSEVGDSKIAGVKMWFRNQWHGITQGVNAFFKQKWQQLVWFSLVLFLAIGSHISLPWYQQEREKVTSAVYAWENQIQGRYHPFATSQANHAYLQQVAKKAQSDILLLTELSIALDVVASSQIGVSFIADFNVTVGQAIAQFNQVVEYALLINIASAAASELISLLAHFADLVSPYLFALLLWLWLFYLLLKIVNPQAGVPDIVVTRARILAREVSLLFIVLHLALPYAIHGAAMVSHAIGNEQRQQHSDKLTRIHSDLVPGQKQQKLKSRATASIDHLKSVPQSQIHDKTESIVAYLLRLLALNLFELIVMPALIMYGLVRIAKRIWREADAMHLMSVQTNSAQGR